MKPSELDPERWRRIDAILEAALDTPPDARSAFLAEACGEDDALRSEVEALLEAHRRAGPDLERREGLVGRALASAALPDAAGRRVGPFRLQREIGRGGMGVVYLAEDTRLGRDVALKALPPYLGAGARSKRRFLAEARAVAALDHPNIATLHEADETEEGQLYMVFSFYEGETLAARIGRGPLPVEDALRIASDIAAGLQAAHDGGVVHRDVKPSNVLLSERGEVKLLDFGVAKVAGQDVTRDGARPGTLAYMSPEQAGGGTVDRRTDLWSLGVVLYEMLGGRRPFTGEDRGSVIRAILDDDPDPLRSLRSDVPDAVGSVVRKLLCKEPDRRYRSAADLRADLDSILAGGAPGVAVRDPPPAARRTTPPRLVVAGAVLVLAGAGAWLATRPPSAESGRIERLAVLPFADLTGDDEQRHLAAGVHAVLNSELGKIGSIAVTPRTSVARYRGAEMPLAEIARELRVDALVEGEVFLDGDSLTVTTTLWEASSPEHQLWTGSYRHSLGGVYELSSEVARSMAGELGIVLSPAEESRLAAVRPVDPRAYDAFTLGQFHVEQRTRASFDQARRYFLEAIDIDSTFAPAYAGLAEAYGSAAFFGLLRPSDVMPRIRSLAETALRHDSLLVHGHSVLAAVDLYWERDWEAAERRARRAIEINPSDARSWRRLSEALSVQGRYGEALEAVERGSELERMVPFADFRPVVVLNYMRDFDQALERIRAGLGFYPDFWQGHWLLCEALAGEGLMGEAIAACEEATRRSDRLSQPLATLGYVYARGGRRSDAERVAGELEDRAAAAYVGGSAIAAVYAALGDHDRAFEWLDRAYEERDIGLVHLRNHAWFDTLRDDPRFDVLLDRMGLERP